MSQTPADPTPADVTEPAAPTDPAAWPRPPHDRIAAIPGWFQGMDVALFTFLLEQTSARLGGGDLAELGAYLGKSAALIGCRLRAGETFTVVDLFEQDADEAANQAENDEQYTGLSRAAFEQHYLSVHDELPNVVQGPSSSVLDHAAHGTHRFVHVDASHLYEHVAGDVDAARTLLKPGGVVVFDDFRAPHTPGVAAAVWRATTQDLRPFAVTLNKLYATFDDTVPWFDLTLERLERSRWRPEVQRVAGRDLVRVRKPDKQQPRAAAPAPAGQTASTALTDSPSRPRRWWRR